MNRFILFVVLFFSTGYAYAQDNADSSLWNGFGIFKLDSSIHSFGDKVKLINTGTLINGGVIKAYEYLPAKDSGYAFAEVRFTNIILFTNETGKISGIDLFINYTSTTDTLYHSKAVATIQILSAFMKNRLGKNATIPFHIKNEYSNSIAYMWKKKKKEIQFTSGEIFGAKVQGITIGINIGYNN